MLGNAEKQLEGTKATFSIGEIARSRKGQKSPKPSYKSAVISKCKECIYDPHAGGSWLAQVTACTSFSCPLYAVRPKRVEAN